ncbi:type I-B CRISPR-associated protein Cas8b1/Cst1 [Brachyspira aalborgi]|uniref:type I-B CRISPR-associated protein Cas8b1/Cst1 n=1 Tax=Brachyspira aalborgi TaxID=29522 RepID=UPI0011CA9D80|nr:type I-B CRISPR-associated protein Cas8b1/Cst1 [Brachyspira aalborgi]TXJ52716.1 type I-B CRISPR-associated protein Cas8b1/Cst1 [Brachyspira aalborgi]
MASKKINKSTKENKQFENEKPFASLDTFLFNAGIIGFIEVLKEAEASKGKNKEEVKNDIKDYYYEGQDLYVSKKFIKNKIDKITNAYINILLNKFGDSTKIHKLCNLNISKLSNKSMDFYYKMFESAYINTICTIIGDKKFGKIIKSYEEAKKKKQEEEIMKSFSNIIEYLNNSKNSKLKNYLILSQIALNKISLIYYDIAFLKYNSQTKRNSIKSVDLFNSIKNNLFEKCNDFVASGLNEKSSNCIICDRNFNKSDFKIKISFLISSAEDMSKKTSVYWNKKPDTYICPICYMIYSCAILGFTDTNNGIIFANYNNRINNLIEINKKFEKEISEVKKIDIVNRIIEKMLELKTKELASIQVISKIKTNKYYSVEIISKDILNIIHNCKKEFETLSKIRDISLFGNEKNKISIFDECLKNLFNYCNQYNLIYSIIISFLSDENSHKKDNKENNKKPKMSLNFLYSLLKIQIKQKYIGGYNMNNKKENNENDKKDINQQSQKLTNAQRGRKAGYKLKKDLGDPKEADNKIKGFIYQLLNSVQTGNRDLFFNTIIRMYIANDLPIPKILSEVSQSIDDFREIGYAFILGLKSSDYKKGVKNGK